MAIGREKHAPYGVDFAHTFYDAEQELRCRARPDCSCVCISRWPRPVDLAGADRAGLTATRRPRHPDYYVVDDNFICTPFACNKTFLHLAVLTFSAQMAIGREKPAPYGVDFAHTFYDAEQEPRCRARPDCSCVCISRWPRLICLAGGTGRLKPPVAPGTPGFYVRDNNFICASSACNKTLSEFSGDYLL